MHLSLKGSMDRQPLTDRLGDRLLAEYGGAAAAYSLRALNGNGDSVVRVRRASDNDEKDFTAEQIELGEMVNWVNSQIVPPLDIGVLTPEGRIPVPEGGTSIGIPAAAYSLRNLSTTYTGNVVDVRRSSDDAEDSFTATEVADGTLTDWVGVGNDGFVSKWYDQSGNDNHATQGTAASQPKIVDGGVLLTGGIDFDGVDDGLAVSGQVLTSSSFYAASVIQHATGVSTALGQNVFGQYQATTSGRFQLSATNSSQYSFFANATDNISGLGAGAIGTSQTLISVNGDGSNAEIWRDGTSQATDTYSGFTPATVNFTIGIDSDGAREFNGKIAEIIIYPSDQSDNRTAIEANIGETYGITGIPAYDNTVDGFVETWYDQSGDGNDATQSVAASQPKIVDGGSLVTGGLDFDGVNDFFGLIDLDNSNQPNTIISVSRTDVTGSTRGIYGLGSDPSSASGYYRSSNNHTIYADIILGGSVYTSGTEYLRFDLFNGASSVIGVNGASTVGNSGNRTLTHLMIGDSLLSGVNPLNGRIRELIIYPTDQSSNRVGIETNINDHYNIY
jgi:hypothetical protein